MRSKNAQIIGQVFVFILAALVFVLILGYGYRAIVGFIKTREKVAITEFNSDLEAAVKSIRISYKSVRKLELSVPSKYKLFCAVDPHMVPENADVFKKEPPIGHPLMYSAWRSGMQNIFLWPPADVPILIEDIEVLDEDGKKGFLCIDIPDGRFVIGLEGVGDKARIIKWQE